MSIAILVRGTWAVLIVVMLGACSSAQKTVPHLRVGGFGIRANLDRDDLVVLGSVEGSSTTTSILLGLVQVIDGEKLKILFIPFFKEKYTYFSDSLLASLPLGGFLSVFRITSTADRAYYKALEKAPDADLILLKSMDREGWGIPILFSTNSVTFRGKAVKLRSDQ